MNATLEFIKTVLQKVSFDRCLFEKELKKGLKMLVAADIKKLKKWCYDQFGESLKLVLNNCFRKNKLAT